MRHKWDTGANLRRLYEQRIGDSMTQKEFGRRIGISQSMVAQILSGDRAMPIDLAPKFAKELRCSIYDISPEMADYIKDELLPVLGKGLRRAAVVLLTLLLWQFQPSDALASVSHNIFSAPEHFAKALNLIHIVRRWAKWLIRLCELKDWGITKLSHC